MFKLFVTILVFLGLALAVLGLRQYRLELEAQRAKLASEVRDRQQKLWDQDRLMAKQTNPLAVADGLKRSGLDIGGPGPTTMAGMSRGGTVDRDRDLVGSMGRGRH